MAVQLKYMKFWLTAIPVLLAVGLSGCGGGKGNQVDFLASTLDTNKDVKLASDYKDKPVVVYMWATWCGPCKQFAPTLNQMSEKYKAKGIDFLAISGEKASIIKEAEKKEPHHMTVLVDTYSSAMEAVEANALPTIVILDKTHHAIYTSRGWGPTTEAEMRAALDSLS